MTPWSGSSSNFQQNAATTGVIIIGTISRVRNTPIHFRSMFSSSAMPRPAPSSAATTAAVYSSVRIRLPVNSGSVSRSS